MSRTETRQDQDLAEALLAALQATFGHYPGQRATHAKGLIASAVFTPSAGARLLSRAAHWQGPPVPVSLRFSNFSGIPQTPDTDPSAAPQGLGLRFHPAPELETDIVAHSFNGFPTGTPQEFLQFLQGIAASLGQPEGDPAPLERFLATHPQARAYLEAAKPAPPSYVAQRYYGINAVQLLAADGTASVGRYRFDPVIAVEPLAPAELQQLPPDYLSRELAARLCQGPAKLRLQFQLAGPGDDSADGSIAWPHEGVQAREEILLGEIRIDALLGDQAEAARRLDFDPCRLIDGLALSDDPMLPLRSTVYRLAASRRR